MKAFPRDQPEDEIGLPAGSLAERIRLAAINLEGWRQHPEIRDEFERSLRKRAGMWGPIIQAVLDEIEIEASDSLVRLIGAWFTMIHLSAPVDQAVDRDPMSSAWKELGHVGSFDLVLALKDEVLAQPLASPPVGDAKQTLALAQATVALCSATLTAAIGSYLDVAGALAVNTREPPEHLAYLYDRLVGWKSASIYKCLMSCLAIAGSAPPPIRIALEDFGRHVGYGIQVLDDAGGVWGGGDDLEKDPVKVTFPIAYGIVSQHTERDQFIAILTTPAEVRDVDRARAILNEIDALRFLEFLIEDRRDRCEKTLAPVCARARQILLAWYESYFRRAL